MSDKLPFIGGSYQHRTKQVSAERTVNWWHTRNQKGSGPSMLLGAPGVQAFVDVGTGPIYGLHFFDSHIWAISGEELYRIDQAGGTTLVGTLSEEARASMSNNINEVFFTNGSNGYTVDISGPTVTRITDGDFISSSSCTFQDGFAIFSQDNGTKVINSAIDDATSYDALDVYEATQEADTCVAVESDRQYVWVFKKETVEILFNAANAVGSPFSPQPGALIPVGIISKFASTRDPKGRIIWCGSDGVVYRSSGLSYEAISNDGIQDQIKSFSTTDDAYAFSYNIRGYCSYVITFPTEKRTFEYREDSGDWNERESFGLGKWRASDAVMAWGDKVYVGDTESGKVGLLDLATYQEWGNQLEAYRICPHYDENRREIFVDTFEFIFETGVGNTNDPGQDPECILRWSENNGRTFKGERTAKIGKKGEYGKRAIFRALGGSVDRVWRLSVSDPVQRDLIEVIGEVELGEY